VLADIFLGFAHCHGPEYYTRLGELPFVLHPRDLLSLEVLLHGGPGGPMIHGVVLGLHRPASGVRICWPLSELQLPAVSSFLLAPLCPC
jgi:hypothetical protein